VKRYHDLAFKKEAFVPGKTRLSFAGRVFDAREMGNLVDASLDFWLTAGKYAQAFERDFSKFFGSRYCLLVNSGSSANLLAVSALMSPLLKERRLKPGDEVIVTACGFPTTVNPVVQNGLIPVFVDVGLGHYNIDPSLIEKAITSRTKAIVLAHTLGNPADLDVIMKVVRKYKLWFIEDNCDALGSTYRGRLTGTFGHISTYSFFPAHHITMGEGGAVLTDDPLLHRAMMSLRDWGRDCQCPVGKDGICGKRFTRQFGDLPLGYDHKYVYSHIGYNLKATDMQAAIGCAQLKKLPGFIKKRKENFQFIYEELSGRYPYLTLPAWDMKADPSWFGFPILVGPEAPFARAQIVQYLEGRNIVTRMLFGGNLVKQPAYKDVDHRVYGKLLNTDLVMERLFWVGVYPGLTPRMLKYIVHAICDFIDKKRYMDVRVRG
jgi:CDP-6-deoxy-D-xylo-4-hexulose-3-dehydrase